jgi:hypothetical protein
LLVAYGPLANRLAFKWSRKSPLVMVLVLMPQLLSGNENLRPSLWGALRMPQRSWLVDTTLRSIMLIRGLGMGSSTIFSIFLSWPEFFASPTLNPSWENANPLPW